MKEYIAYQGEEFTIEWYYNSKGESPALEYFNELDEDRQDKVITLFGLMAHMGKIRNETKFRNEGDGIYAFKPKPDRFLCFFSAERKLLLRMHLRRNRINFP